MKSETAEQLERINRTFYARHADAFSDTRATLWPGVARMLDRLRSSAPRVLDLGCGNGRLLPGLVERFGSGLQYRGIDASERLLELARARHGSIEHATFSALELAGDPAVVLPAGPFDLCVLLAVLHHVPSEARRHALLRAAAMRLSEAGHVLLTLWRFDSDPRFAERRVAAEELARLDPGFALDADDLEPGDCFLRFGSEPSAVRYCHFPTDAELERLLAGLTVVERFHADGRGDRLNEYLLLR